MALLHVDLGTLQGQIIPLTREKTLFGRDPKCDVVVSKDEIVSRKHAQILCVNDQYYVEDLKSRNRTYVNDRKIPPEKQILLKHKDRIRICQFQATFLESLTGEYADENSSIVEARLSSRSDHRLETQPAVKLAALLEITVRLSKTRQLDAQLPEVAEELLTLFSQADRCFLILLEAETGNLLPKVVRTRRKTDETKETFSRTIVRQCLKSGQALLLREPDRAAAQIDSVIHSQMRSVMCVPLCPTEGEPFGVLQLDTQDDVKKFTEDDLRLLWAVSSQVSSAMENARFYEERLAQVRLKDELELARQVHLTFFPQHLPDVSDYEFYVYHEPAREVGGDYHDFIVLPDQRLIVTIGDVAGKGMPAALLMARLTSEARYCFLTENQPTAAVGKLNNQVYPLTSPTDRFVTLLAVLLDPVAHTITLINAGHPAPLMYRRSTQNLAKTITAAESGLLLGIQENCEYSSRTFPLEPGDYLLLFSDGVTDAQSATDALFRTTGIEAVLEQGAPGTPRVLGERIVQAVQQHALGRAQYDDITLICFGRPADSCV